MEWPLVGRSVEVAAAVDALSTDRGVVLAGEAGVGKSRLARAILTTAADAGWATFWFAAGAGTASVPFSPFASLVDELDRDPVDRLVHARRTLVEAGDWVVIAVDDAHLLDDVSVAFVRGLIVDTDVRVIVTVRTGSAAVPLWTESLGRTEVPRLSREAVGELVAAAAGVDVDPMVVRWIWTVTEGNPLFVRELMTDALERGALAERSGRLVLTTDPSDPGSRVQEIIANRIGALDDDERTAVELLALSEPVCLGLIEHLVSPNAMQSLERRHLVRDERRERRIEVRLAHPLHGEVTRTLLGPSTTMRHRRRLLDALLATGARRADDQLQIALWRAEIGDVDDPDQLLAAAHELARASEAVLRTDFTPQRRAVIAGSDSREVAVRLARAALIASGSTEAAVLLSWLLIRVGRHEEAMAVVQSMDHLIRDDGDLIMVLRIRTDLELMLGGDPMAAMERLEAAEARVDDPVLKCRARATRAAVFAVLGRFDRSLELGMSVYQDELAGPEDRITAGAMAASAIGMSGRSIDACALLDEMQVLVTPEVGSQGLAALMIGRILLLAIEQRLEEMLQLCSLSIAISDQAGSDEGIAVFSGIASLGAVSGGQCLTALRLSDDALRRMVDVDPFGVRGLALTARTTALGYLGRAEEAALALDDLMVEPRSGPFTTVMLRAKAWAEVAAGRTAAARRTLGEAATVAVEDGRLANEIALLHDQLRIAGDVPLARIEEVAARVDGPYAPLVLAQARGLVRQDAALLEEAARGHESMSAHLYAAECWAQAAGIHRRAGRKGDANDAAGHSRVAIGRCEGPPVTPALVESEPLGSLTKREREIVGLAAEGLSDKEIAERLVVSARTVQTHLYNAYAKLGVDGREGLAGY